MVEKVEIVNDDLAATAYKMAHDLWDNEYNSYPKATDAKFMALVSLCVAVLSGRYTPDTATRDVKKIFDEQ